MNDPVINGNILTVFREKLQDVCHFALVHSIETFSIRPEGEVFQISFPVTKEVEASIPGILHGARARLKAAEKPKPPTGGGNPDGTPPNGGTPGTPTLSLPETWVLPSAVAA